MQSKRDQVHSWQFFMQRVISALIARESDPAELPFRRLGGAALGSVMVAVLALTAVGVYGLLVGGGATSWRDGTVIIVERETGTRYVYREQRLHPVVNLASARLLLGPDADVKLVSARSLVGVPRGPMLGIPGAPEGLPGPERLLHDGWAFCSQLTPTGSGDRVAESVLGVGVAPDGGADLDPATALLVRDAVEESDLRLLWRGHRHDIDDADPVLAALGATQSQAVPVAGAWLDALPAGESLSAPAVSRRGRATDAISAPTEADVRVGQVIEVSGAFYLVGSDRLTRISPLLKDIILADPETEDAYPEDDPDVVSLGTSALSNARIDDPPVTDTSPPPERPRLAALDPADSAEGAVCLTYPPGTFVPSIRVGGRLAGTPGLQTSGVSDGIEIADRVHVPPGWAVLVSARSAPDAQAGPLHLVTDQGIRYGLADAGVAASLGYDPDTAVPIPASLLDRLPSGPALDPAAARQPVSAA